MSKNRTEYPQDLFPIGKILKTRGLKGEVRVFLYNVDSNIISQNIFFWIKRDNCFKSYNVEFSKKSTKYQLVKFTDIINIDQAQKICDKKLYVSRLDLFDKKGYYLIDLIGFLVKDELNIDYGKVVDIINLPTNDSLLIDYHNKEIIIPIMDNFIELFDYENEVIFIKNSNIFINEC